jgi:hypothetical protein
MGTAYTTVADGGNWSASVSWTPGTATNGVGPAAGDTVTIAHNTTVDVNSVCGASGIAGTASLSFSATASNKTLTIAPGVTLALYGDLVQTSAYHTTSQVVLGAGSQIVFHPTATVQYKWTFAETAYITANGTSGSHAQIRTDLTGPSGNTAYNAYMAAPGGSRMAGFIAANYCDVTNFGVPAHYGVYVQWDGNNFGTVPTSISITNCTFTGSNLTLSQGSTTAWDQNITFTGNKFTSSVISSDGGAEGVRHAPTTNAVTGTRLFSGNYFDAPVCCIYSCGERWQYNIFGGGISLVSSTVNLPWAQFDSNLSVGPDQLYKLSATLISNFYFINTSGTTNAVGFTVGEVAANVVIDGCIFEAPLNTGTGDMIWPLSNVGTPHTFTVRRCLTVPSLANGSGPGALVTACCIVGVTGTTLVFEHNTVCTTNEDEGAFNVGRHVSTASPFAGELASCQGNLTWSTNPTIYSGVLLEDDGAGASPTDMITLAGHNNIYGAATPTAVPVTCGNGTYPAVGYGWAGNPITISSNGPLNNNTNTQIGYHDAYVAPQFVDSTRSFQTWGQKAANVNGNGSLPTVAATCSWIFSHGNSTQIPAVLQWVRAGFHPTAVALTAYTDATHAFPGDTLTTDAAGNPLGGTLGALAYMSSGSTATKILLFNGRAA